MNTIIEMQNDLMKIADNSKNFKSIPSLTNFLIKNFNFNNEIDEKFKNLLKTDIDRFVKEICKSEGIFDSYRIKMKNINSIRGTAAEYYLYLLSLVNSINFQFPKLDTNFEKKIKVFNFDKNCYLDVLSKYHDIFYNDISIEVKSLVPNKYNEFAFGIIDHLKRLKKNNLYKSSNTYGARISRFMFLIDISQIKEFEDIFTEQNLEIVCIYDLHLKEVFWLNIDSNAFKNSGFNPEQLVNDIESFKDF